MFLQSPGVCLKSLKSSAAQPTILSHFQHRINLSVVKGPLLISSCLVGVFVFFEYHVSGVGGISPVVGLQINIGQQRHCILEEKWIVKWDQPLTKGEECK